MQIVTIFGDNKIFVRTSSGTTWTEFYDYKGEIENLKSTVVDGKTSVANAINGHLATQLSNQTAYSDLAYYITNQLMKKLEYKDFIQTFNNTTAITFEYYNVSAVSIMVGPGITFSVMSSKAGKLFFMNVNGIASGGPLSYKDVAPNTWVGWDGSPSGSGTAYVYLFVSTEPCNVSIYRASGTSGGGLSTAPIL